MFAKLQRIIENNEENPYFPIVYPQIVDKLYGKVYVKLVYNTLKWRVKVVEIQLIEN